MYIIWKAARGRSSHHLLDWKVNSYWNLVGQQTDSPTASIIYQLLMEVYYPLTFQFDLFDDAVTPMWHVTSLITMTIAWLFHCGAARSDSINYFTHCMQLKSNTLLSTSAKWRWESPRHNSLITVAATRNNLLCQLTERLSSYVYQMIRHEFKCLNATLWVQNLYTATYL